MSTAARVIDTDADVHRFVEHLNDPARLSPTVLLTCRAWESTPMVDVTELVDEVGDVADVFIIRTGPLTWLLGDLMPERTHAYGGAVRAYPAGTGWHTDPYEAPLRIIHDVRDADAILDRLIDDVESMADRSHPHVHSAASSIGRSFSAHHPTDVSAAAAAAARVAAAAAVRDDRVPAASPLPDPAPMSAADAMAKIAAASPVSAPEPEPAAAKPGAALRDTQLALAAAESRIRQLEADAADAARTVRADSERELRQTRIELARTLGDIAALREKHSEQIAAAKKKRAPAATPSESSPFEPDLFASADDAVRHAITCAWVQRVPAADKATYPLPDYVIGERFADTLASFDKPTQVRALRCAVDVLTDLARDLPARRVHALRSGVGGDNPARVREGDGAVAFRANVETGTASARRLHYWKLPDGRIELARVVVHDDVDI